MNKLRVADRSAFLFFFSVIFTCEVHGVKLEKSDKRKR